MTPAEIAASLTKAQRAALKITLPGYCVQPDLPGSHEHGPQYKYQALQFGGGFATSSGSGFYRRAIMKETDNGNT